MPNTQLADNIHKLRGTYRKDRHGDPAEKVEVALERPSAPSVLADDEEALVEWDRICGELEKMGLLAKIDRALLTQYCLMWSELCDRGRAFGSEKHTQLRMIQQQMGITPVARCKLSRPKGNKGSYSDFT